MKVIHMMISEPMIHWDKGMYKYDTDKSASIMK